MRHARAAACAALALAAALALVCEARGACTVRDELWPVPLHAPNTVRPVRVKRLACASGEQVVSLARDRDRARLAPRAS